MIEPIPVQVLWGPREETTATGAARWRETRLALAAISPLLSGWFVNDGEADLLVAEETEESLVAGGEQAGGYGHRFAAYAGAEAPQQIHFRGTTGRTVRDPRLFNTVLVEIQPATAEQARPWFPLLEPMLAALARIWRPDWGHAGTWRSREALRPGPYEPWTGRVTYLSPGRCARVPDDLAATTRATPEGGVLLTVPDTSSAVDLAHRLRESGALAPVPEDRARL